MLIPFNLFIIITTRGQTQPLLFDSVLYSSSLPMASIPAAELLPHLSPTSKPATGAYFLFGSSPKPFLPISSRRRGTWCGFWSSKIEPFFRFLLVCVFAVGNVVWVLFFGFDWIRLVDELVLWEEWEGAGRGGGCRRPAFRRLAFQRGSSAVCYCKWRVFGFLSLCNSKL